MDAESTPPAITILICDDTAEIRGLLRDALDHAPSMEVVGEAPNGAIGIREAARLQPDVILLDLAMPVLSGLDALPLLREAAAASKIIVYSGYATAIVEDRVLALGADKYLAKGARLATIIAAIEHIARSQD